MFIAIHPLLALAVRRCGEPRQSFISKFLPAPTNGAGSVGSASYKHATPGGGKTRKFLNGCSLDRP
jgi:hypothetical protein